MKNQKPSKLTLVRFRKLVRSILPGRFLSRDTDVDGVGFEGFRPYEVGDPLQSIDFTASLSGPVKKKMVRLGALERNVVMVFIVDASSSMDSEGKKKTISDLWNVLCEETERGEDQLGCVFVGERIVKRIRPARGGAGSHLFGKIENIAFCESKTSLSEAFRFLLKQHHFMSQVAIVISDMLFEADYEEELRRFKRRGNEALFIIPRDQEEEDINLPLWAMVGVRDSETGESCHIKGSRESTDVLAKHIELFQKLNVGCQIINTSTVYMETTVPDLKKAFDRDQKKKKGGEK